MRRSPWKAVVLATVVGFGCASDSPANPARAFASISVSLSVSSLAVGQTAQASATLLDAGGQNFSAGSDSVEWSSSNTSVAAVSTAGLLTAIAPGNAVITGAFQGRTGRATVSVVAPAQSPVATISVALDSSSLVVGHLSHAFATLKDPDGKVLTDRAVTWGSSNTSVAAVSQTGLVTAVSAGNATITAASESKIGTRTVTVLSSTSGSVSSPAPPTVALSLDASVISVGKTAQAGAVLQDSTGVPIPGEAFTWSSSNDLVASVSPTGVISAVATGTAAITATNPLASGTTVIVVAPASSASVASITVMVASPLTVGTPALAIAIPKDSAGNALSGRSISWASSNTGVATVSIGGTVTPVANGAASIIATAGAKSGSAPVNVGGAPTVTGVVVVVDSSTIATGHVGRATATPRDAGGNPVGGKTPAWSSSNSSVLTVTSEGIFTAKAAGTADVIATVGTITGSAKVTVSGTLSVATVSVSFLEGSIIRVPNSTHAVATLKSSSGTVLGGTVTWSTSKPSVAQVSPDGTVIAMGPGSAVITGTSGGKSGTGSIFVPDGGEVSSEPVFDAGKGTLVMRDDMESYLDAVTMGAVTAATAPRIVPQPAPIADSKPVNTAVNQVISPGHSGGGKALRMLFPGLYQSGSNYYVINAPRSPTNATHYFQYYARVNFSAPLTSPLAVKWFLVWHRSHSSTRVQWATHDHLPWPGPAKHSTYWGVYDQAETSSQGFQPVGPHFSDVMDNAWHRFTYQYRPNSYVGARDGFARMWIDGVKVIDVSISTVGIIPPGGEKVWCNADDLDNLVANDDVVQVNWGATQTTVTPPWTLDIDDFVWWRTP